MINNVAVIAIGVYMLVVGICTVTNITIDQSKTIIGYSALIAGVICLVAGITNVVRKSP